MNLLRNYLSGYFSRVNELGSNVSTYANEHLIK